MRPEPQTYIGKPCDKHGHVIRYVKNRKCRQCNIDDSDRRNKIRAAQVEKTPVPENQSNDTGAKLLAMRW